MTVRSLSFDVMHWRGKFEVPRGEGEEEEEEEEEEGEGGGGGW